MKFISLKDFVRRYTNNYAIVKLFLLLIVFSNFSIFKNSSAGNRISGAMGTYSRFLNTKIQKEAPVLSSEKHLSKKIKKLRGGNEYDSDDGDEDDENKLSKITSTNINKEEGETNSDIVWDNGTNDKCKKFQVKNTTGKLETFHSKETLSGDFEIRLKLKTMKKAGFSMIGLSKEKITSTDKYFADNGNQDSWGISTNGYVAEYGKLAILPSCLLREGSVLKIVRKNHTLAFTIDDTFNNYGYLMEGPLYLTVNMKTLNDEVEIVPKKLIKK